MGPPISGTSRLVKYDNLARFWWSGYLKDLVDVFLLKNNWGQLYPLEQNNKKRNKNKNNNNNNNNHNHNHNNNNNNNNHNHNHNHNHHNNNNNNTNNVIIKFDVLFQIHIRPWERRCVNTWAGHPSAHMLYGLMKFLFLRARGYVRRGGWLRL